MSGGVNPELLPEPEIKAENIPTSEPEAEPETWPEIAPDWKSAFDTWGPAWETHIYVFALAYFTISALSLFVICAACIRLRCNKLPKLTVSLCIMLLIFSLTRSFVLFADPYHTNISLPFEVSRMIWSMGLPGLTASYNIVFCVLLDTTKMSIGPPVFQNLRTIWLITSFHFVITVATDVSVMCDPRASYGLIFCESFFILYGFSLAVGYTYVALKLMKNLRASQNQYPGDAKIKSLRIRIHLSGLIAACISITHVITLTREHTFYSSKQHIDPWEWWIVKTSMRLQEVLACFFVLSVVAKTPSGEKIKELLQAVFTCKSKKKKRVAPVSCENATNCPTKT